MRIETLLRDEIEKEIKELGNQELGTEKYKLTVDSVTKLVDRVIEFEKIDMDQTEKGKDRDIDTELKVREMNDEKKDRYIKNYIAVGGIVIPLVVTIWGALKSWEFEKEGTVTTVMGKGFMNKLLPKK